MAEDGPSDHLKRRGYDCWVGCSATVSECWAAIELLSCCFPNGCAQRPKGMVPSGSSHTCREKPQDSKARLHHIASLVRQLQRPLCFPAIYLPCLLPSSIWQSPGAVTPRQSSGSVCECWQCRMPHPQVLSFSFFPLLPPSPTLHSGFQRSAHLLVEWRLFTFREPIFCKGGRYLCLPCKCGWKADALTDRGGNDCLGQEREGWFLQKEGGFRQSTKFWSLRGHSCAHSFRHKHH